MRMFKLIFLSLLMLFLFNVGYGQTKADNYNIHFSKMNQSDNVIHVKCEFDVIFEEQNSGSRAMEMRFGGQLKENAVQDLEVKSAPDLNYDFNAEKKRITFYPEKRMDTAHITMNYNYLNFSTTFNYRGGAEFWETSYQEFYYPHIFGQKSNFIIKISVPDTISVLANYSLEETIKNDSAKVYCFSSEAPVVSHSVLFGLLPDNSYHKRSDSLNNFEFQYYLLKSPEIPKKRLEELNDLTVASINYFSDVFEEGYRNTLTGEDLTYAFHTCDYSNRNDGSFIIASQKKVATKPHLLPMVHEIGHRWIGEWTLLIDNGQPAAYFINESLNEYMELLFAKDYYGEAYFDSLYQKEYVSEYNKISSTSKDTSLYSMTYNNNNTVVYKKGVIIIHKIVDIMGEDQWLDFMKTFYSTYKYEPELTYSDFLSLLRKYDVNAAERLDELVRCGGDIAEL